MSTPKPPKSFDKRSRKYGSCGKQLLIQLSLYFYFNTTSTKIRRAVFRRDVESNPRLISPEWILVTTKQSSQLVVSSLFTYISDDHLFLSSVVWKSTTHLGIARAVSTSRFIVVANYSPPGNYEGQFPENVLPPVPK